MQPVVFAYHCLEQRDTRGKEAVKGKERLANVLAHHDLGAFRACRRFEHGHVNETWVVDTTRGRYVVKHRHPELSKPRLVVGQQALMWHLCAMRS